jgi:Trypsin
VRRRRFWFRVLASPWHPTLCGAFLVAAGACAAGCASEGETTVGRLGESIIGGTSAGAGDFPAAAAIFIDGALACSGVLITPKIVLTSTLCFDPNQSGNVDFDAIAKKTTVYAGAIDVTAVAAQATPVVSIRPDPDDDSPLRKIDHCLVELTSPSTVIPATVNAEGTLVPLGTTVTLVGYGATRVVGGAPDRTSEGVLHAVPSVTKSCASFASSVTAPKILCFDSSKGSGACNDTGGPSFVRVNGDLVLVGTHSRTDATCSQYSLDTRTDTDLPFIGSVLCAADGYCASACGTSPLAADPDCPVRDAGTGGSPDASGRGDGGANAGNGGRSNAGSAGSPGSGGVAIGSGGVAVGSGGAAAQSSAGAVAINPGGATNGGSSSAATTNGDSGAGAATIEDSNARAAKADGSGCTCRLASQTAPRSHWFARWLAVAYLVELVSRRRSRRGVCGSRNR